MKLPFPPGREQNPCQWPLSHFRPPLISTSLTKNEFSPEVERQQVSSWSPQGKVMLSSSPISQRCSFLYQDVKTSQFFWSIIDLQNFRYTEKWLGGPWSIKWSKQRLTEFCQENELVIANTLFQQHKRRLHMDITRWSILKSDWLHFLQPKMEKSYTVSKNTTRSRLWLRSWTPYCQIQTYKLKKTGKTTRPFKYDWNPLQLYRESDK